MTLSDLKDFFFIVLSGLLCIILTWVGSVSFFRGNYKDALYVLFLLFLVSYWGYFIWASMIGTNKKRFLKMEEYAVKLRTLPYEEAVEDARDTCTIFPSELALRKVQPTGAAWCAFERDSFQFIVEKNINNRAKVVIFENPIRLQGRIP